MAARIRKWTLGYIDMSARSFRKVISLPGYLRGLSFHGKYAVVGSSIPRDDSHIEDADVLTKLAGEEEEAVCGLFFINLEHGRIEHFVRIRGGIQEIFDVAFLPGAQSPDAIGMRDDRIKYVLKIGQCSASKSEPAPLRG